MENKYQIAEQAKDDGVTGVLTFQEALGVNEAEDLYREINELLQKRCMDWIVCLDELSFCDSVMLGIWVLLHAMVRKSSGTISFKVRHDSHVHRQMVNARLDQVFSIQIA